jgi:5-methylcytosine-specific restriction endonuclease McrA
MGYSLGRSGTAWTKLKAQVFAEEEVCWWCRKWVDQTLPREHRMSRTVDHVVELWQGGDPLDRANCRLAHRRCNSSKSQKQRTRPGSRTRVSAFSVNASDL